MIKKNIIAVFIIVLFIISGYSQTNNADINTEISKIKSELETIKKDIQTLKEKTEWFTFRAEGSIKMKYGVNILSKPYYGPKNDEGEYDHFGFDANHPITHGFDFENKLLLFMDLADKIVATSTDDDGLGTKIILSLKLKSMGISEMKPEGSWYVVQGQDDQGNTTDIYFPRYEKGGSNIYFGNFQFIIAEAKVKDILGTGFFVNYKDVMTVDTYYGVGANLDILKLNHEYFNNGFMVDRSGESNKFASIYYSFDADSYDDYEPESQKSEAVKLWSNNMLRTNPDDTDSNQKPHGMSFGYDKALTDFVNFYIEAGIATKDAFDPKYYTDDNFDFGFFIKTEPRFYSDTFEFWPKLNVSFAMQTETDTDTPWQWSTFAAGLGLPFSIGLPSGKNDRIKFDVNFNINANIVYQYFALLTSTNFAVNTVNDKFFINLPFVYSFKNANRGGFLRSGHEDVVTSTDKDGNKIYWIDQLYDDHVINAGFITGFKSKDLFGDIFEYQVTNSIYFAYMQQYDHRFYINVSKYPPAEIYFYNIHRHEFIFHEFGVSKLGFFFEYGLGYGRNMRLVDSETQFKYIYDRDNDTWTDTDKGGDLVSWYRWNEGLIMFWQSSLYLELTKNLSIGLDIKTPKIAINCSRPIGNQRSYSLIELWSEIKF
jgi:hypothetical protein